MVNYILYKIGSNRLKKLLHKITVFIKQLVDLLIPILLLLLHGTIYRIKCLEK